MNVWSPPSSAVLNRDAIMFIENRLYFCPLSSPPPPTHPLQTCIVPPPTTQNHPLHPSLSNNEKNTTTTTTNTNSKIRDTSTPVIFLRTDSRSDGRYHYQPFFSDFGPCDLGAVYRFCDEIDEILKHTDPKQRIVHCVHKNNPKARSNGAFLTAAYCVLRLAWSAQQAFAPLLGIYPPIVPFRDASYGLCTYTITVYDCLKSLQKAIKGGLFGNPSMFDSQSYSHYSRVENGDWHWIIKHKLLACSGPHNQRRTCVPRKKHFNYEAEKGDKKKIDSIKEEGEKEKDVKTEEDTSGSGSDANKAMKVTKVMLSAEDYALLFVEKGISNVVRLNDPTTYDKTIFLKHNIAHQDMYFTDGSVPTSSLVSQFIRTMDSAKGAVAVHCKAGLGRTGTMASAYLMHKYHFTAKESIAWIRIVRPGSIVGPQQHYLERLQPQLHSAHSRNNAKHKQSRYQQHHHQQQQRNVLLSHSGSIAPSPLLYETEYGGGGGGHSGGGRSTMSMSVGQQHKQHKQQHRQNLRPRTSHEESQQMKMQQLEVMQLGLGSTRMLRSSSGGRTTSQSTPSLGSIHGKKNKRNSRNQKKKTNQKNDMEMDIGRMLREFVPMVNTGVGSSGSMSNTRRAATSVGRRRRNNNNMHGSGGGVGRLSQNRTTTDRSVNGMCRGRPKGVAVALNGRRAMNSSMGNWQKQQRPSTVVHSLRGGSGGLARMEPRSLPGVTMSPHR